MAASLDDRPADEESTTMTSPFNSLSRPARPWKGTSAPMKRVLMPALGLAAAAALGTVTAAASPAGAAIGSTGISNNTQVTNHPGGISLDKSQSKSVWYSCGDYNRITTPAGAVSAYPYGPNDWTWENISDNWVSAK